MSLPVTKAVAGSATPVGPTWGHSGFFPGYQSELVHLPERAITLALQVNSSAPRPPGTRPMLRAIYDFAALIQ